MTTYLTGTRYLSPALARFLPDYLDLLHQRGEQLLTTNKPGVDRLVIQHCDENQLPLQVCDFTTSLHSKQSQGRRVKVESDAVQVRRIVAPTWQRFRHILDAADKLCFFHAGKPRGTCHGMTTIQAFEQLCQQRDILGQQFIVQLQLQSWVNAPELRQSPILGAAHVYIYARFVPGLDDNRYCVGQFRVETWRQIGEIVQPGEGRREFVISGCNRRHYAELQLLEQALLELKPHQPERLIVHHANRYLPRLPFRRGEDPERQQAVRQMLEAYPQVVWQRETPNDLRQQIGQHIAQGQELWDHKRRVTAFRGLYE